MLPLSLELSSSNLGHGYPKIQCILIVDPLPNIQGFVTLLTISPWKRKWFYSILRQPIWSQDLLQTNQHLSNTLNGNFEISKN